MGKFTVDIVPELMVAIRVIGELEESEQMTHNQRNKVNFVRSELLKKLECVFRDYGGGNADLLLRKYVETKYSTDDLPF